MTKFYIRLRKWEAEGVPTRYYVNGVRSSDRSGEERTAVENFAALFATPVEGNALSVPKLYFENGRLYGERKADLLPSALRAIRSLYRKTIAEEQQKHEQVRAVARRLDLKGAHLLTDAEVMEIALAIYRERDEALRHYSDAALTRVILADDAETE